MVDLGFKWQESAATRTHLEVVLRPIQPGPRHAINCLWGSGRVGFDVPLALAPLSTRRVAESALPDSDIRLQRDGGLLWRHSSAARRFMTVWLGGFVRDGRLPLLSHEKDELVGVPLVD